MNHTNSPSYWQIMQPVQREIYFAMAASGAAVCFSLTALLALAFVLRAVHADFGIGITTPWLYLAVVATVAAYLSRGLAFKMSHLAAFALERILRYQLTERLAAVPLGTLSTQGSGALTKVIRDDVHELHTFVADSTPLYARAYLSPVLTFIILLFLNWQLALLSAGVLLAGMIVMTLTMSQSRDLSNQYNQARDQVNQAVVEFVQAMPVVRTFDDGKTSFQRYESALDKYLSILTTWYRQAGTTSRLSMLFLNPLTTLFVLIWAGSYAIWHDNLRFATWIACLLLGTGMAESWLPMMAIYHLLEKSKISVARIFALQDLPILPLPTDPQTPQDASVTFHNVAFRYPEREQNALSNISFHVPAGSFTALVGASGAGKSTVARLIPRFWDVTSGHVAIGGVDVRDIAPAELMAQVAFVFQDNFLFSGTIADNIRLGHPDKTMSDVVTAAQAAQADAFIRELPQGYDTPVGERGMRLSGGQRQRITIARAILQNRPILVLDEATAFADAENEALLMNALQQLMQGKTVLMIAHRLATIHNADQVLFFERGQLIEQGTPAELLARPDGAYAKLWQAYQQAQNWHIAAQ